MAQFEYLARVVIDATLEVDDPGNCVILGRNDLGQEYYLVIKTVLGNTFVVSYGPITPDIEDLPQSVGYWYEHFEFDARKIHKLIDKFLNDSRKAITQAEVTDIDSVKTNFKDLLTYVIEQE